MPSRHRVIALVLGLVLVESLVACGPSDVASFCAPPTSAWIWTLPEPRLLDLLIVVDDSSSMTAFRSEIQSSIPHQLELFARGDANDDGIVDFTPPDSIRVAVVTSDLGGGAASYDCTARGDGAAFRDLGGGATAVELIGASASVYDGLASALDVDLGGHGCGVEQPFAAATAVIARGDFVRPDSHFVVLLVTDEDDCSSMRAADEGGGDAVEDPYCRQLAPIDLDGVADAILGVRDNPALVGLVVLAGIPVADSGQGTTAILSDPMMEVRVDPTDATRLVPSCTRSLQESATPPVRATQLRARLEAGGALGASHSICEPSFPTLFDEVVESFAFALDGHCLGARPVDALGQIDCELTVTLPAGRTCEGIPGLTSLASGDCLVHRVARPDITAEVGWAYDDGQTPGLPPLASGCDGDLAYVGGLRFPFGTRGRLRCWDGTETEPHCE